MTTIDSTERTQLHEWIDLLPQRQINVLYQLVAEFIGDDDTLQQLDALLEKTQSLPQVRDIEDEDITAEIDAYRN